jgi:putative transposase
MIQLADVNDIIRLPSSYQFMNLFPAPIGARLTMPRSLLIRSDIHPYHITSRCNNKEFFPLPLREVWPIMLNRLRQTHEEHNLAIHAFVLMGNHFHLLCHTPKANIDEAMHFFLRMTSVDINLRSRHQNHIWGGRYKWSLIDSQRHYYQVYRYIYQNPIRAQLVSKVQDYPFSTLAPNLPFPLHSCVPMSFAGHEGEILWLNERYEEEDLELIKSGLRKAQFDLNKRKLKAFNKLSVPISDKN